MNPNDKLFAVYLGGRAPRCNTELHDVVFVTGQRIEDTYEQLLDKWFGSPKGLHLNSWLHLDVIDGYRISLSDKKTADENKLYFVNLGAYQDGVFSEIHANKFFVAKNIAEAKTRAKQELLKDWPSRVHTDDLYEVDDCVELGKVNAFYVTLTTTNEKSGSTPNNAYHIIPKALIESYMQRHASPEMTNYRDAYKS